MAATGISGIDVLQTSGGQLVLEESLKDAAGAQLITGTTNVYIYEVQADGTLKSFDWNGSGSFITTALTTPSATATHQTGNNGTTNTGVWIRVVSTLTGFTVGAKYIQVFENTGSSPPQRERKWQFGGNEGDQLFPTGQVNDASATTTVIKTNLTQADNFFNSAYMLFVSGALMGESRKISSYANTNGQITVATAFTSAPANNTRFVIIGRSE